MDKMIILILATFAISAAITGSDGPFGLFARIRKLKYASMTRCFLCTSVWIGLLLSLTTSNDLKTIIINAFALAGGATAIDRISMGIDL